MDKYNNSINCFNGYRLQMLYWPKEYQVLIPLVYYVKKLELIFKRSHMLVD